MVKLSEVELPVIIKNQPLFKAGRWNGWNILPEEVDKSVNNTTWDNFNTSLIYSHKDKNPHEFAESWIGNVRNIHAQNGTTFGDLELWDPDTAIKAKYGKAPMAVSAGIAWDKQFDQPKDFFYRNFSFITDPGVRDKDMYVNFSASEPEDKNFKYANFENMVNPNAISDSSSEGSPMTMEANQKNLNPMKMKKKKVNFDSDDEESETEFPIDSDKDILRAIMSAEIEAISLYEDFLKNTTNPEIIKVVNSIIGEEKIHLGEAQTMLGKLDPESEEALEKAEEEVEKTLSDSEADFAKVTDMEAKRKELGMSVDEFYAVPRDPPSSSSLPMFDAAHVRNALARLNQVKGLSSEEKAKAHSKLMAKAHKLGIDKKEADMMKEDEDTDDSKDDNGTEAEKKEVIDKKLWTMQNQDIIDDDESEDEEEKKRKLLEQKDKDDIENEAAKINFNNDERRLKNNTNMGEKDSSVKANFENEPQPEPTPENSQPEPVVTKSDLDAGLAEMKGQIQEASPLINDKFVEDVADKVVEKMKPVLTPAPMTTKEFGQQARDPTEETIERLAKGFIKN